METLMGNIIANQGAVIACTRESEHAPNRSCSREASLVTAAQAGMSDAMDELLVRNKTTLYRAARRFTDCHEDAEDLVQDAMLRAFVNVNRFRKESSFGTWLVAIVNNAALSMRRRRKHAYYVSLDSSKEDSGNLNRWDVPDVRRTPEEEAIQQELFAFLDRVLLKQSRSHQKILERCVFNEVPISETASALGLTLGSAKSSLYRARRRISNSFERRGLVTRRNPQPLRARLKSA